MDIEKTNNKNQNKGKKEKYCEELLSENPNKIPIILNIHPNSKNLKLKKNKFLISKNYTINQLNQNLKKFIDISSDIAVYFYYDNNLLKPTNKINYYYNLYKNKDSCLYLHIGELSTYGDN